MGQQISLGFDANEREFFARALEESGGPAHVTDALAAFVGFIDAADMVKRCNDIADQVRRDGSIDAADLRRSQLACEILFSSDIHGSGLDWEATTGLSDADAIGLLRRVQVKMLGLRR
ncbi:hypothetical protein SAMN05216298_2241 [Glycomyces sambucus]|uniref:Uncharacterized protein n=1 Tax=Glycomyces sambucus TaxID=380244 RepID=A0A1G9GJ97_9ACTN|nr:hypothetical protein [Glycomyces sambucus]SDL00751.1 hypothetical protein SAMN05216298_2241 [Glycomyces sambucus]